MWETKEKRRQRTERIRRRKAQGLQNRYLYNYTFASNTSHDSAQLGQARAYVEHWRKAFRDNVGLAVLRCWRWESICCCRHCKRITGTGCTCTHDKFPGHLKQITGMYSRTEQHLSPVWMPAIFSKAHLFYSKAKISAPKRCHNRSNCTKNFKQCKA